MNVDFYKYQVASWEELQELFLCFFLNITTDRPAHY